MVIRKQVKPSSVNPRTSKSKHDLGPQFLNVLTSSRGERKIHSFLKKHPEIVLQAFNCAWKFYLCVPEFELGNDFRADFLILSAHSLAWHAIFVELETSMHKLYLRDGRLSERLGVAYKQITDWRAWYVAHQQYVRESFAKLLRKAKAESMCSELGKHRDAAIEICDPSTLVQDYYYIVINRSSEFDEYENQARRAYTLTSPSNVEVATYDRLLTAAYHIDLGKAKFLPFMLRHTRAVNESRSRKRG